MIAFRSPYPEQQPNEPHAQPEWHAPFLAILPQIREHLRFAFRKMPPSERADAMAECVANVAVAYARLHERGKQELAFASTLAAFATKQFFDGRRVGCPLNANDVSSEYCRKRRGFRIESLDHHSLNGDWRQPLVEDRRSGPAEIAAARLDIGDWFDTMSPAKRAIAETLAMGESTKETANMFGITSGRVSQVRKELVESWDSFQAQALALA
jgi:DNA-directed RNA polymerase specialized sigma24 family protein